MKTICNQKRGGQLSLFNKAWILFMLLQVVTCKCDNKLSDDGGEAGGGGTTKQPEENKSPLILTGPAEVKARPNTITLDLEVTNGTWNTSDYTLAATDLNSYNYEDYTAPTVSKADWTTVSGINGETLQVLTGNAALNKGDKKTLSIPVKWVMTTHLIGPKKGQPVIHSESAEFRFAILDKAGNPVAGPIEVKWTCAL